MNFSEKIIQNISSFKAFIVAKLNLLKSYIDANEVKIADLEGMVLYADMANQKILIRNASGVLISEVGVGWLNNEGTTFTYNESTEKLELRNDADELLSEIPVSSFVSNLAKSISLSGSNLHLRDTENNILSSVTFQITNIQGLQAALDLKANDSEVIHKTGDADQLITGNDTEKSIGDFVLKNERPLYYRGKIEEGDDLNNLEFGFYLIDNSQNLNNITNFPTQYYQFAGNMVVEVWNTGAYITQKIHKYQGFSVIRTSKADGDFENWKKFYTDADFSQSDIDQWNEVYSWGDHTAKYIALDSSLAGFAPNVGAIDFNSITKSQLVYSANGANMPSAFQGLVLSLGRSSSYSGQLWLHNNGTDYYLRNQNNGVWGTHRRLWTSGDFTQTEIDQWNQALLDVETLSNNLGNFSLQKVTDNGSLTDNPLIVKVGNEKVTYSQDRITYGDEDSRAEVKFSNGKIQFITDGTILPKLTILGGDSLSDPNLLVAVYKGRVSGSDARLGNEFITLNQLNERMRVSTTWQTCPPIEENVLNGTFEIKRIAERLIFRANFLANANGEFPIAQLPEELRPDGIRRCVAATSLTGTSNLFIQSDGLVIAYLKEGLDYDLTVEFIQKIED
ncbi:pyocin knob domain-containing protein [Mesonia aestuariivivens]|uniref:Pyocin knob domain-containing protein n=1 Tax=Mesonia aestuariivivens TaxID=2796128 RepID=A0ABS6W087_9FLAO|nr:pyocin knob domain-containing protein [Mesonia aestuariivivens]MBW2961263.1 pyocin knob domain-containing protein [Mesonia aestuariivivens]